MELRGRLRVNEQNTIILQVPDAEHITKVDSSLATWEFMKLGFHPLLLPTTAENEITVQPNSSESDSHNKKPSSPEEHATTPSKVKFFTFSKFLLFFQIKIYLLKLFLLLIKKIYNINLSYLHHHFFILKYTYTYNIFKFKFHFRFPKKGTTKAMINLTTWT